MRDDICHGALRKKTKRDFNNLFALTVAVMGGQAAAAASMTGIAWMISRAPVHRAMVPYLALANCGWVLLPFLYSARLAKGKPTTCAIRLTVGTALYVQAMAIAMGFGAIRLGILSQAAVLESAPFVLPLLGLGSAAIYAGIRHALRASRPPE